MLLRATADLLRVVTTIGGASLECHVSAIETDNATPPVVQDLVRVNTAAIATATTTTILDCTTSGRRRRPITVTIRNDHASVTETAEVIHSDGTTVETIMKATLLPGESLYYDGSRWFHYDTNAAVYPSTGNAASQSDQETGTSTSKYVSPGVQQYHPSAAKFWVKAGVAADIAASYNITSLTDTGTGIVGITIAADFSSSAYCAVCAVEASATTWAVANTREVHIRNATLAAGTLSLDCVDNTGTTSLVKDPSSWHCVGFGDL
jgi:hypothetical protein